MIKTYYLTKEGLRKLEHEREELLKIQSEEFLEEAPVMLEGDSLSPEFSSYRENLDLLDQRIEELNYILKNYKIIKMPPKKQQDKIDLGAKVLLKGKSSKEEYKIVGTLEADPFTGRISNESPLGVSFIGKRVGETISFNGLDKYKILKIKYEEV
ncbi:MAG: GreA/GreB family elongation factor [Candidatus Pacebacteria bacterium]|nr:GreA/GreB family elongation factor [Candidatus Paceibacterota bacterium]MDD4074059.1 GreA/GreB family elongation factor [Candidatus Paceibacterota bacterium]